MNLGKIIHAALAGDAGVSALAGGRIYPDVIPQEIERPSIAYEIGSLPGVDGSAPLYAPTVNVSCFAREKNDAHVLSLAVDARLDSSQGVADGVVLKNMYKVSYQEMFDPDLDAYAVVISYTAMVVLT